MRAIGSKGAIAAYIADIRRAFSVCSWFKYAKCARFRGVKGKQVNIQQRLVVAVTGSGAGMDDSTNWNNHAAIETDSGDTIIHVVDGDFFVKLDRFLAGHGLIEIDPAGEQIVFKGDQGQRWISAKLGKCAFDAHVLDYVCLVVWRRIDSVWCIRARRQVNTFGNVMRRFRIQAGAAKESADAALCSEHRIAKIVESNYALHPNLVLNVPRTTIRPARYDADFFRILMRIGVACNGSGWIPGICNKGCRHPSLIS